MKTNLVVTAVLVLAFVLSSSASQITVTGILTDDMCTKKHMMPGKPNADCVRECIKHGAKYVIVSSGKVLVVSGKQEQLASVAGKKVSISGLLKGDTIVVSSIEVVQ